MITKLKNRRGFTLPFVAMVAFGLAILIFSVTEATKTNTHQMVYFNNMNRTYRLAESGASSTLGQLSIDPSLTTVTGNVTGEGEYTSYVKVVSSPTYGTFYVVTSATRTVGGRDYVSNLHTYASVTNVGEYFAAFQNEFILSAGINATGGKVYAPNVGFMVSASVPQRTEVKEVEYVYSAYAQNQLNLSEKWQSSEWTTNGPAGANPIIPNEIYIDTDPVTSAMPRQLVGLKKLPSVTSADLSRYRNQLGGASHIVSALSGNIFPPGYRTPTSNPDPLDTYAGHTNNNLHHVYYAEGNLVIGDPNITTVVYGQVLFVATGSIVLRGSIISATAPNFPGEGNGVAYASSSTAHQAVFITPKDIVIGAAAESATLPGSTTTIHGLMYAPHGNLTVMSRFPPITSPTAPLCYRFIGSQIFSGSASDPNNLPTQFAGARTYSYMPSLKSNPPPYIPALILIYHQWEDVVLGSIF